MFVEQPLDSPGSAKYLIIIIVLFFFIHMFIGLLCILDAANAMIRTAVKLFYLVSLQCALAVGKAKVLL